MTESVLEWSLYTIACSWIELRTGLNRFKLVPLSNPDTYTNTYRCSLTPTLTPIGAP